MDQDRDKAAIDSLARALTEAPAPIRGQWYFRQHFYVDGYTFIECRFENCKLISSTANFQFVNCLFSGCGYYFAGTAQKAIKFYNLPDQSGQRAESLLQPTVGPDGRLSITG